MNPSFMGQGINSATFESGIHSTVLQCIINRGQSTGVVETNTCVYNGYNDDCAHSNWTFECLAQTATNATLYHKWSWSYSSNVDWIVNNNINTVSRSTTNGGTATSDENRTVDHFAYRYPFTTFCNPTANAGYCFEPDWQCYNAINVGNVRHTNETHYEMMGLNIPCQRSGLGAPITQAKNPASITGHNNIPFDIDCVALGGCATNYSSDREMPHIVTPGYYAFVCGHSTACLQTVWVGQQGGLSGTSFSAPVTNGIAACVQSANSTYKLWPELTRAVIILTAHNVYGDYWSPVNDGIDGTGVISGVDAVSFARNASYVSQANSAVDSGYNVGSIPQNTGSYYNINFSIKVPDVKPAGKHLRIVLTWDSSPSVTGDTNELADLDLVVPGYACPFNNNDNWGTWESNVEVADIANNRLTPSSVINPFIRVWPFTIPPTAYNKSMNAIYYSLAWTWVKDHAD
jgi:hypothetical protein